MTLKLLNKELVSDKLTPVLFVFPPIEIPVNSEGVINEEDTELPYSHYASVVYDINAEEFALLEYSLRIFHAVASYNQRHGKIEAIEVLLSRHPDGRFKMNIGNTDKETRTFSDEERAEAEEADRNLIVHYKDQNNYTVHDL